MMMHSQFGVFALQQRIWNPTSSDQGDEIGSEVREGVVKGNQEQTIGFR